MPRVHHVKKARKNHREIGVKKGEEYWWWRTRAPGQRCGRTVKSATRPRPSQLAHGFAAEFLSVQEAVEDLPVSTATDAESSAADLRERAKAVQQLGEDQRDKRSSMPESLQESPTGQLLEDRAEVCDRVADELDSAADDLENLLNDWTDDEEEQDSADEARSLIDGVDWSYE